MENIFKCTVCERTYQDETTHERHIQNIHGEKLYPCDRCDESFVRNNRLQEHMIRKHLKTRNFICDICKKGFLLKPDLKLHVINKHTDDKPYKCEQCDSHFKRVSTLYSHQRTHDTTRNEQCPVCMKNFKNKESVKRCLNNHVRVKEEYSCTWDGCKASLTSPEGLKSHLRRSHIAPKERVKCNVCSKDYADQSDLKRHVKFIHEKPEKKFRCDICELKFFTCKHLERHMQIHEGNTFHCWYPGCLTKRSTMYDLRHHYKKRHDTVRHQKDYIPVAKRPKLTCELCGKQLKAGASPNCTLRLHMERHKDHTLDFCPVENCDYKFYSNWPGYTVPGPVYQHLLTSHGKTANQMKTVYKCKECDEKIVCVQRGVRKSYEEWSKALVVHMMLHRDGEEEVGDSDHDVYKKYQGMLKGKEWRTLYNRYLDVDESRVFLNQDAHKNNDVTKVEIFKSEFIEFDSLASAGKEKDTLQTKQLDVLVSEDEETIKSEIMETEYQAYEVSCDESRELTEVEYHKAFVDVVSRIPIVLMKRVSCFDN